MGSVTALSAKARCRRELEYLTRGEQRACIAEDGPGPCAGPPTCEHVIEARWLEDALEQARIASVYRSRHSELLAVDLETLVADADNAVWACHQHNCQRHATGFRLDREKLPQRFWDFLARYPELERYLARVIA